MNTNIKLYVTTQWDRVSAWVAIGLGVIFLIVGWVGISDKIYPGEQLPYILSAGVGGVFLLGLGAMLWLSADLRDEWRKLDSIERAIREEGVRWSVEHSYEPAPVEAVRITPPAPRKAASQRRKVGGSA